MNDARWGRRAALSLVVAAPGLVACAGGAPADEAGAVTRVDARVDVVVSDADVAGSFTPLVDSFIADDSGLYWYDGRGAVFARRFTESQTVELRPPLEPPAGAGVAEHVIGMADDEERLFVGQAFLETSVIDHFPGPAFQPPGRLIVIPKDGSPARVVVELDDATITPIASDDTRVIVHVEGGERAGFHQLVRSSLELEPLPLRAPFYASERAGDTLYWSDGANPPNLMRARFDDVEAERVAPMERTEFDVGPGYALTRQERLVEPEYLVAQNFVLHDAATGSERPLPGMGETISLETALDARHAYWFSYRGEGPGTLPPSDPLLRLVRVDIASGALSVLETPGLRLDPGAHMIGQNARYLYIENSGRILAVEKP